MNFDLSLDKILFVCDLAEYRYSDEGQALQKALKEEASDEELRPLFDVYWNRRNGEGLTYSNEEAREKGKQLDQYVAELYKEQN